jgi:hypothetical protein
MVPREMWHAQLPIRCDILEDTVLLATLLCRRYLNQLRTHGKKIKEENKKRRIRISGVLSKMNKFLFLILQNVEVEFKSQVFPFGQSILSGQPTSETPVDSQWPANIDLEDLDLGLLTNIK